MSFLSNLGAEWSSVKCSPGFEVCLALQGTMPNGGEIYRSVDGGNTWTVVPGMNLGRWNKATCDATGTKWIAALSSQKGCCNKPGGLYVSTDSGASFTMVSGSNTLSWRNAACDASFNNCIVGPKETADANNLVKPYRLTNLQTLTELQGAPAADYQGLVMSADGERILAAFENRGTNFEFTGSVWYSLDGGNSWTQSDAPLGPYGGVACDPAVKHCAAAPYGNPNWDEAMMATSCDGGLSWTSSPPLNYWGGVTVDADGGRMVAVGIGTYSYPLPLHTAA